MTRANADKVRSNLPFSEVLTAKSHCCDVELWGTDSVILGVVAYWRLKWRDRVWESTSTHDHEQHNS